VDPRIPITTTPEWGFYKTRYENKPWEPVAIWQDENGKWIAYRSGKEVETEKIDKLWEWCCGRPITEEAYDKAVETGEWDGDDPTVASMIGHNVGDISDVELLKDQIENAKQGADAYRKITSDDQAAKAQSLRARMNELAGLADKKREALKKPHLEAGRQVDAEWQPIIKDAKAVADVLRKAIEDHETAKLQERRRIERERQRAEQERLAEEERAREEARAAEAAGRTVVLPPTPAPLPPPLPPPETKVKGTYGRAANVGTELVVTAVIDQDALYHFLREHNDLRRCLYDLATRAVRAGHNPPGITYEERAKVT
jgi:hypothetical protein